MLPTNEARSLCPSRFLLAAQDPHHARYDIRIGLTCLLASKKAIYWGIRTVGRGPDKRG
jgi:hypothetical protein